MSHMENTKKYKLVELQGSWWNMIVELGNNWYIDTLMQ